MSKYQNKYRIESARLSEYDYSNPNWYYVTINTKNHNCHFGDIKNGKMLLNDLGKIVEECWNEIPKHYQLERRDVACNVSTTSINKFSKISPKTGSLSAIIRSFKSAVTNRIHEIGKNNFQWQTRFYD